LKIKSEFKAERVFTSKQTSLITFVNPYSYYIFNDSGFVDEFDFIFSDAISFVILHNILNFKNKINRKSFDFTSMAPDVLGYCQRNSLSVALVGGGDEIVAALSVIKKRYPLLNVTYSRNGYFKDDFSIETALEEMKDLCIEVLICGMGTPLQESFLCKAKNTNPCLKAGFTCGGFLTQIASKEDYFNPLLSKLNLRWLQRFIRHGYVRRRLLVNYPIFLVKYTLDKCCEFVNSRFQ
jgi:UDP-N-acetyl-D-mannosaminuronic acid transferase (WecB/TagA/CpsF family)